VKSVRFLALLTVFFTAGAFATVFAPMTDRQLIDRSDAIVVGTVTAASARIGGGGYVYTDYQLSVEDVLKGDVSRTITISEIGGSVNGKFTIVEGSAKYTTGARVLTFLRRASDGTYFTSGMTRGAFNFSRNIGGVPVVVRDLAGEAPDEPVRLRDAFMTYIRTVAGGGAETQAYESASPETLRNFVPQADGTAKAYALTASGFPVRWLCGTPTAAPCTVPFKFNTSTGSIPSAVTSGAAQWTNDPNALITLSVGAGSGLTLNADDCVNAMLVATLPSDPRCDGAIACTLGSGGSSGCTSIPTFHTFDGDQWVSITDADIVFSSSSNTQNNSAVTAHEFGHAIGIRHSNQGSPSSANAVMTTSVSTSTLQQWDKDAVDSIYGNGPVTPPCKVVTTATANGPSTVTTGNSATLTVSNDGDAPFTYQWFKGQSGDSTSPISGATNSSLNTGPINQVASFWVKVSNCPGVTGIPNSVNSNTVTVTPVAGPTCTKVVISTQPQSQQIGSGTTATLSVGVTGTAPFSYQWYEGAFPDTSKPVATTASFTTPALTKATSYWVHVSNQCGQADSATATITIIGGQCTAPTITKNPSSRTILTSRPVALVANASGDAPITFTWFNATSPNQSNALTGLGPSDERFIRMLYVDLLGRDADSSTVAVLVGLLQGTSRQTVALNVLTSPEYDSYLISSYYRNFLGRSPSTSDLSFFLPFLTNPGSSDEEVAALILGSAEYFTNVAGGTNAGFVNQVYSDVLGRTPSAGEILPFVNFLSNGFSRSDVALLILRSAENRTHLVNTWFNDFLRRAPTGTETSSFVGLLNNGSTQEQVMAQILGTNEYNGFGSVLITSTLQSKSDFWVRATNNCTGGANSNTATITVLGDCTTQGSPVIVTQPQNATTITGVPTTVGVGVTGGGPFAFQWFEGTAPDTTRPVSGGTNAQLIVLSNAVGTKTYWVRVSNACSRSVNSNTVTVTINCGAPAPLLSGDTTVRSGLAHKIYWSGDNVLYSSFELQTSTDANFTNPQTQTLPAVQLNGNLLNEKSFTDTVSADTRIYYRIRGKSACNGQFSEFSRPVSTLVQQQPPASVSNIVLNIGGNTTLGVVSQDLFIPGLQTSGKMALATNATFTVTSDRDFVTITPSTGPLPPEGTTVKVSIDTNKILIGSTQANLIIVVTEGSGKLGALGASRTTSTSVSASKTTPVTSTPKDANASPDSLIVLAVGHGQGASGPFQSDVRVTNLATSPRNYQLTFTPAATDGTLNGKQTQLTINAGETKALNDIVAAWFGAGGLGEASLGTLEVRPLSTSTTGGGSTNAGVSRTVASSLTYFVKQDGATFGQYIPALPLAQFLAKSSSAKLSIQQIQQNPTNRTNIGLVEGSGQAATAELRLFDKNNTQIAATQVQLKPFEFQQRALTDYFGAGVSTDDARLEVRVLSDLGKVTGYASVVENKTSDPTLVFPTMTNLVSSNKYVVPGVANLIGANNSNFHTDMRVYNAGTAAVPVTMSFSGNGTASPTTFTLQPGEVKTFNDVVKNTFGLNGTGGAIVATTQSASSLVLTARTYSIAADGGTFGQFIPGVTPSQGVGLNESALNITQLEQSPAFRTNAGIVEVNGQTATVRLSMVNPDAKSIPTIDVTVGPNQFVQLGNVFSSVFPASSVYNGRISAQVVGGTGKISVYGSLIDNKSNDPAFIPGQ